MWLVANQETGEWVIINDTDDEVINKAWGYWDPNIGMAQFSPSTYWIHLQRVKGKENSWLEHLSHKKWFDETSKKNFINILK